MLRLTGILAATASACLIAFLFTRTQAGSVGGTLCAAPPDNALGEPGPGERPATWIASTENFPPRHHCRLMAAGVPWLDVTIPEGEKRVFWAFRLPKEAAERASPGDTLIVRGMALPLPPNHWFSHVRYELRGSEIRTYGEPDNMLFVLVWLAPLVPLALWGLAALLSIWFGLKSRAQPSMRE